MPLTTERKFIAEIVVAFLFFCFFFSHFSRGGRQVGAAVGEGDLSTVWTVYAKYFHAVYTFIAKYLRGRQGWGTEGGGQRGLKMPTNGQQNGHVSATFMQLLHGGLKMLSESRGEAVA